MMMQCCTPGIRTDESGDMPPMVAVTDEKPKGVPMWLEEAQAAQSAADAAAARRAEELEAKKIEDAKKAEEAKEAQQKEEAAAAAAAEAAASTKKSATPSAKKATAKKAAAPKVAAPAATEAASAIDPTKAKFEFEIKITSARGLRDADWLAGTSDPYCLIQSQGGKTNQKFKTKVVDNKENPVWNQRAKMTLDYGNSLKFTILDYDQGKEDDLLGWMELPFDELCPKGVDGEFRLKDASDTAKAREAYVKVAVKLLRSYNPEDAKA
eukprot:TRINITY_DN1002_c1_g1_i1.p1 TRINITY_DN1002_c1_g1~~TRINITY_DN1002_c1_g1_i1.p1  ORF type:complete len:267 (+),score=114.21 TRINITY_DN1002_c1_g1_i1:95-895(+)